MEHEFWIDVGGTFTDCLHRASDGSIRSCKVLSSGHVKGQIASCSETTVVDPNVVAPGGFYTGYRMLLYDAAGECYAEREVSGYDGGRHAFAFDMSLPGTCAPGHRYELTAGEEAPVLAIRQILACPLSRVLPAMAVRLGTTRGTNALLERKGAAVGFLTTHGFEDLLSIGHQARPHLFELAIQKRESLVHSCLGLHERIAADGTVLKALDMAAARQAMLEMRGAGAESLAICLLNAYANPEHEQALEEAAESLGFTNVSVSHRLTPTIKFLDRADTTVVDAYLAPVIREYVSSLQQAMPNARLRLMSSAGSLLSADSFGGRDSIVSGPAGGVVGFSHVATEAGFPRAIGFDMGGTSTDVSRFDGEYEYQYHSEKAGVRIVAPMYAIETVAAGGGSICAFDGQRLVVGPDSAGAVPGPVCYGQGGPLSVTDINLFNGKVAAERFPFPLNREAVVKKLTDIGDAIVAAGQPRLSPEQLADGFTELANLKMATAIKQISSAHGYDPGEYTLVSFGGAGAQHACAIADILGMARVLLHPHAGILSALGIGMADVRKFAEETILKELTPDLLRELASKVAATGRCLHQELVAEGVVSNLVELPRWRMDLRYVGEEASLTIGEPADGDWRAVFEERHQQHYGHRHQDRAVEIVTLRVEVAAIMPKPASKEAACVPHQPAPSAWTSIRFQGISHKAGMFERETLAPGAQIDGPAMIHESFSTIVVDPGWQAEYSGRGDLVLKRVGRSESRQLTTTRDPIRLELFNNHFGHIATQMGLTLQRTALSVNVKERLDFSCAILDARGDLIVNAPHIPVHLGAMGASVKGLLAHVSDVRPGDVYVTNDPDLGGSHLPDVTVITPVFDEAGKNLRFFTASRAHHAEIGGIFPGSGSPFAKNLAEEGVVLRNLLAVRDGAFLEGAILAALADAPYPSRAPQENLADIRAAVAANHVGAVGLEEMIAQYGWPVVEAFMGHMRDAAEEKLRAALKARPDGVYEFADGLDDGSPIVVALAIVDDTLRVDFTGSGPVNPNSLNANCAIVQSAVLYCLRCLLAEDIPLNAGVLAPVELIVPEGMLNPPAAADPHDHVAVIGGNVELSQRVVDVVLAALGLAAASQGTMNNVIVGNEDFGYYETICGGTGAGPGFAGADAVHSHMTNTRVTDVEIYEARYPIRVKAFAVRHGSGGAGRFPGGNGVVRTLEFLAPLDLSLLTQRRARQPFGLAGGEAGAVGINLLTRAGSEQAESLPGLCQLRVEPGDCLSVMTPGGGGYGTPD